MTCPIVARASSCERQHALHGSGSARVSEEQLLRFLEESSNRRVASEPEMKVLGSFLVRGKRRCATLASKLEKSRVYSEDELNAYLARFHSDVCTLRRELIINRLMVRKAGKCKVVTWNQPL